MKKAIVGFATIGAFVGLRPLARRVGEKMREHCAQMAAQCSQFRSHGEAIGRT